MKLFDRVEILIDTETVPRGCRGVVVDVLEPDGCCVEFLDDENNTIDVLPLCQRDLALVQLIDRDGVRAQLQQLDWGPPESNAKADDRPDVTDRGETSANARRPIMVKRANNICSECGTTECFVLESERVALDMAKLHAILDYVLGKDPHASIRIWRDRDNEFMVEVECDDAEVADEINFSRECNRGGIWFGAKARDRSGDDPAERDEALEHPVAGTKRGLTLGEYLLSAPRGDELEIERSRELPRPDPFAESPDAFAEPLRESPAVETLEPLARDYVEGRADAAALLGALEAAQLDIGPEDDEQERLAKLLDPTRGMLEPGSFDDV